MSNLAEQLRTQIKQRYEQASGDGTFGKLAMIARELGESLNASYGPKYKFLQGGIEIYVDDYGHYMTVTRKDGLVEELASTHPCSRFIKSGDWLEPLLDNYESAKQKAAERAAKREAEEVLRLQAHC